MLRASIVACVVISAGTAHAGDPAPSTAAVTGLAVVSGRTCALHADGDVSCWGDNERGLLGPGTDPRPAPVGMPVFHDVVQLEGVVFGTCALRKDKTVACLGMTARSKAGLEVQPLADVVALRGTCALHRSGEVSCFSGKRWDRVAGVTDAIQASGSAGTGCAVHRDHTVSCWAKGSQFPTAIGAAPDGSVDPIDGVRDAVEVSAGMFFACARLRSGAVSCWGMNGSGELGRGTIDPAAPLQFTPPALVPGLRDAVELVAGAAMTCARRASGKLACWGGIAWTDEPWPRPTEMPGLDHVRAFATGDQSCAVLRDRDVRCWGSNRSGELGDGTGGIAVVAREVPGLRDAVQLDSSNLASCALRKTGELKCWGLDANPKFGARRFQHVTSFWGHIVALDRAGATWVDGERTARPTPKASMLSGPCSVVNGGEVWCSANQKGPAARNPVTKRIGDFSDAVEIAGNEAVCIRRRGGVITCVLGGFRGEDDTTASSITDAIALAASDHARCAVRADHSVWCWGDSDSILLGRDPKNLDVVSPRKSVAPARVPITDAVAVAIGGDMDPERGEAACAIKRDGTVWCWGASHDGRLGTNGGPEVVRTPVQIRGVTDATQLSLGWVSGCAVQRAGTVVCWGSNESGELGTQASNRVARPVAVRWP